MRRKAARKTNGQYKILVVDDDQGIIDTLKEILGRFGYDIDGVTDPVTAIDLVHEVKYDMLLLDFIMSPIHGNEVVERIRRFNKEIYILLLTGHKDLAPPLETIRQLDIQGYCEKSDRFDQLLLLVESGIKSITQMRAITDYRDGLNNVLRTINHLFDLSSLDDIQKRILNQLQSISNSGNVFIMLQNEDGRYSSTEKSILTGLGIFEDLQGTNSLNEKLKKQIFACLLDNGTAVFDDLLILPLHDHYSQPAGVIGVQLPYKSNDIILQILEIYSKQVSSALNNALMHNVVNKTYETLRLSFLDTIEALRITVDVKDIYTRGHSDRVSYYSQKIGESLNLNKDEINILRLAGIFHDIGKIGISDQILFKDDILTNNEFEEIYQHPKKGANILSAVSMFKDVAPVVLAHHEKLDGTGYPSHLKDKEIPYLAKVIAVADAFDAMMTDRHYRRRLTLDEAKKQLLNGKSIQFDSNIVDVFLKLLDNSPQMVNNLERTL